ncbi:hypothetical protein [Neobacillus sp. FSL H8-0543]|uniref:hypothetical protein n=1 Tax=Neobacillus sp. FSL H8-0543 TaxID=2954672 RepID=UPI003158ADB9
MEPIHQEMVEFYKHLEKLCNKRIHDHTNCRTFTYAFGRAMEFHLDQVMTHREWTKKCLTRLNLPTKDEIASIAIKMVDSEEKLDILEENIYLLTKKQKENNLQLNRLKVTLSELVSVLESEMTEKRQGKLKTLAKELNELKQLFT